MKSSTKISVAIVVMALITVGGLWAQYRATNQSESVQITAEQVEQMIAAMPEQQRKLYAEAESKQRMLNLLQEAIVFGAEARRLGYANRPENVYQMELQRDFMLSSAYRDKHRDVRATKEEIDEYYRQNPGALDEYARYNPQHRARLQEIKPQLAEIRLLAERARQEGLDREPGLNLQITYFPYAVLREALLRDLQTKTEVSQEEIQAYYQQHQGEFSQVSARHILFSTRPTQNPNSGQEPAPAPDPEAVRRRASEVWQRVKAGEDFAQLAKEFSDDPGSREKGGDLGYFGRDQMVKPFEEAAFKLEPGQISDLVESPFGFHIIKVEDRRIPPLDQSLRGVFENRLRRLHVEAKLKEIRERHPVSVHGAKPAEGAKAGTTQSQG
jgi:peptidyl-prolyl cis-trans isomerase C